MPERRVSIASKVGLHARPAALFVKVASDLPVEVTIRKEGGGTAVKATSVLGLMTLGAEHGDVVLLAADGEGADAALDTLVEVLSRDLDE